MKILLTGCFLDDIKPLLKRKKIELISKNAGNPDLIITHGGDGSLLGMERQYPGVAKLPIRDKRTSPLCSNHSYERVIDNLLAGKLSKTKLIKLSGKTGNRKILGMNDIFIHNLKKVNAIRYRVWINDELYLKEVASDCLGIATPHGSTAYYRSITKCIFRTGIGLAFSNSREHVDHIVIPENAVVKIQLLRGPAFIVADNNPKSIKFETGDILIVSMSPAKAIIYGLDVFMCPDCRKLRHTKI
jgi:NAD+ kinase